MNRDERNKSIGELRDRFNKMVSAVFVDFAGMTVEDVTKLRQEFQKAGVDYKVVKNSLVHHAVQGHPYAAAVEPLIKGMTGIAWSYEEPGAAAKVLKTFTKENPKLKIKGGIVETDVLSAANVENVLASMPGKNELRATLLATFLAPMQGLVRQLNAPRQSFAFLLDARRRQLESN